MILVLARVNFAKYGFTNVIESNKNFGTTRRDYLETNDPDYDLLMTNPSFTDKHKFSEKGFSVEIYSVYC